MEIPLRALVNRPGRVGRRRGAPVRAGLVAGIAALVLYAATGARDVEWQDPGIHQYRVLTGRLEHPLGLALSHPLHFWAGRAALAHRAKSAARAAHLRVDLL